MKSPVLPYKNKTHYIFKKERIYWIEENKVRFVSVDYNNNYSLICNSVMLPSELLADVKYDVRNDWVTVTLKPRVRKKITTFLPRDIKVGKKYKHKDYPHAVYLGVGQPYKDDSGYSKKFLLIIHGDYGLNHIILPPGAQKSGGVKFWSGFYEINEIES